MTPRVVILGAGFAGLYTAKGLRRAAAEVTVVDQSNHHLFQPLLYQVATAGLNPGDIAKPIRGILRRQANVKVVMDRAVSIDVQAKTVELEESSIDYDFLVVATGATHSYFGNDAWAGLAPGLKTLDDALDIRTRLLTAFERAEIEDDPKQRQRLLTFVIIGAGPTGVEMAGSLAEMTRHTLRKEFRNIDTRSARVILVEAADRVLPPFPSQLSERAETDLRRLGVEVMTSTKVTNVDERGVWLGERLIEAQEVLWAAGVKASPLAESLPSDRDRAGRVTVTPDLSLPGHPEVYVIGDLADVEGVPGIAPAAIQMGKATAKNILRDLAGQSRQPFHYRDKGMLAVIGRSRAVADLRGFKAAGVIAWLLWLGVHIWFLIGFRNRLLVMLQWTWAYLTWERGTRLITRRTDKLDGVG